MHSHDLAQQIAEPHDAHVLKAIEVFRAIGFSLDAMQFKRTSKALEAFRKHNRVPDSWKHPFAWGYHPNEYMQRNWSKYY